MNIRRYRPGEEDAIWRIYYDTTRIINGRDYTPEQVRRWAPDEIEPGWDERLKHRNPFVAEQDGAIVGFAELEADGHIDRFYCHHQWQRKGAGKLLFKAIEDEAARMNIPLLFTEVSVTAKEFFLSRGFEIVEEKDNLICGAIAKNFHMRKRLK